VVFSQSATILRINENDVTVGQFWDGQLDNIDFARARLQGMTHDGVEASGKLNELCLI
jgi:hypothetical protein